MPRRKKGVSKKGKKSKSKRVYRSKSKKSKKTKGKRKYIKTYAEFISVNPGHHVISEIEKEARPIRHRLRQLEAELDQVKRDQGMNSRNVNLRDELAYKEDELKSKIGYLRFELKQVEAKWKLYD